MLKSGAIRLLTSTALGLLAPVTFAQSIIPFNFESLSQQRINRPFSNVTCNFPGLPNNCATNFLRYSSDNSTPFLQEVVVIDEQPYFHVIVGRPEDGFAQEFLIGQGTWSVPNAMETFSDSGGEICFNSTFVRCTTGSQANAQDPLRADAEFTGNGSGNPTRVAMRQLLTGADGFSQEYFKGQISQKPVITQALDTGAIQSNFVMDMSNSDYATDTTPGTMVNEFVINDPGIPQGSGNFDYAQDKDKSTITSGRYTFVANTPVGSGLGGVYTYWDGTVDPVLDVNWEAFRDPAQNP